MGWIARFRAWLGDSARYVGERPARVASVVTGLALGIAVGIPGSNAGYNYTWRNADFCDDCHVHDYANEAYARSVHAGVTTCHDCHKVPISHYPRNMWLMVSNRPQEPTDIDTPHVGSVLCESCHSAHSEEELTGPLTEALRARVVKIDDSPLHRLHLDAEMRDPGPYRGGGPHADEGASEGHEDDHAGEEGPIACLDCHGSAGNEQAHRFSASRDNCLECHAEADVPTGRMEHLQCQECHFDRFVGAPGVSPTEP